MGSASFFIAGIVVLALVAAGVGFYLYQRKGNIDTAGLFAPRVRRLAFVERTSLDGGRKLLLVRRDDVEHLLLVGGPIDLVVESGIRQEAMASPVLKEAEARAVQVTPSFWPLVDSFPDAEPIVASKAQPSFFPKIKEEEMAPVLTSVAEIKAAE